MTEKQRKVFTFIRNFVQSERRPPTIREIMRHFGFTSNRTVQDYLAALEKKGYLKVLRGVSRGIDLAERAFGIPLVGRVPAGNPFFAEENIEEMLDLSVSYFRGRDKVFALRVVGDSMEGAGIMGGDLVIVRRQQSAGNRDIVVALVSGEATVKRFVDGADGKFLLPENPRYTPITFSNDVSVLGKVVGVVRRYSV